jgi:hypothetical protein
MDFLKWFLKIMFHRSKPVLGLDNKALLNSGYGLLERLKVGPFVRNFFCYKLQILVFSPMK